ncbi:MAG: hypothetical protein FRX48_01181 [Lasallia pustulata]|uniref:Ig-like domain-containing protein n=1 Tax=Lasallia pustulata TaxID=136370 RepID=A0A5M8PZB0_9LECA|nr:MAG: hypothetical protein FRX48_01181 [Lasallia pustulata]
MKLVFSISGPALIVLFIYHSDALGGCANPCNCDLRCCLTITPSTLSPAAAATNMVSSSSTAKSNTPPGTSSSKPTCQTSQISTLGTLNCSYNSDQGSLCMTWPMNKTDVIVSLLVTSNIYIFQVIDYGDLNCSITTESSISDSTSPLSASSNSTFSTTTPSSSTADPSTSQSQGAAATFSACTAAPASSTASLPTHSTTSSVSSNSKPLPTGTITGITIASLIAMAALLSFALYWRQRRKSRKEWPEAGSDADDNGPPPPQSVQETGTRAAVEEHGYHDTPAPYQVSPLHSEEDLPAGAHSPPQASPRVSEEQDDRRDARPAV